MVFWRFIRVFVFLNISLSRIGFFFFFFFFCMCMCMFQKERERYYLERKLNMWEVAVQCAQCKPKQKAYSDPFL